MLYAFQARDWVCGKFDVELDCRTRFSSTFSSTRTRPSVAEELVAVGAVIHVYGVCTSGIAEPSMGETSTSAICY